MFSQQTFPEYHLPDITSEDVDSKFNELESLPSEFTVFKELQNKISRHMKHLKNGTF